MNTLHAPADRPAGTTVYVMLAESVQGNQRKMLETGISLMPGILKVRRHIDGVERVLFKTTPENATILLTSVPPHMEGILVTCNLSPAT